MVAWLEDAATNTRSRGCRRHAGRPRADRGLCVTPPNNGAHSNGSATSTTATAGPHAPAPLPQVDALRRQQQRILHHSALVDDVLAAEKRGGEPLTMGDALAELLADITEGARTIGTFLQTANGDPNATYHETLAQVSASATSTAHRTATSSR